MQFSKNTIVVLIMVVVILFGGVGVMFMSDTAKPRSTNVTVPTLAPTQKIEGVPQDKIVEGKVLCLPHKDINGPQTMECAFGLQTDDGKKYALDAGNINPLPYNTGNRIRANGSITPIEALSSDHWQKYDIVGIFSIKDSLEIL